MGSTFAIPLIAHGHSLLALLHLAGAQAPATVLCVEVLLRDQEAKQFFSRPIDWPENGVVMLPTLLGLGLVLDEAKIEQREVIAV
ncbi:MAG: hypothetical protein U0350_15290 [Caldilineaceae bacterium]